MWHMNADSIGSRMRMQRQPRQPGARCARSIIIRWIAVLGQAAVLFAVNFGFGFELPLGPTLAAMGASVLLNLVRRCIGPPRASADRGAAVLSGLGHAPARRCCSTSPAASAIPSPCSCWRRSTVSGTILSRVSVMALDGVGIVCLTGLARLDSSVALAWRRAWVAVAVHRGHLGGAVAIGRCSSPSMSARGARSARSHVGRAGGQPDGAGAGAAALGAGRAGGGGGARARNAARHHRLIAKEMAREILPKNSPLAEDIGNSAAETSAMPRHPGASCRGSRRPTVASRSTGCRYRR